MIKFFKILFSVIVLVLIILPIKMNAEENSAVLNEEVLVINNGFEYKIVKKGEKIEEILKNGGIETNKNDLIFPGRKIVFKKGTKIIIKKAKPVILNKDKTEKKIFTQKKFVWEVLEDAKIEFGENNLINFSLSDEIFPGIEIKIWDKPKPKPKIIKKEKIEKSGQTQNGLASWYSHISGNYCASLTFKKGSRLLVTNLQNGKSVVVKVNDSGPFNGRSIDLEKSAFSKIASLSAGVVNVKVELLK